MGDATMARNDRTSVIASDAQAIVAAADTLSTSAAATNSPAVAETVAAVATAAQAVADASAEHISFDQWWMMMSKRLKLKAHIKEILHADFKARGLSLKEPMHKFESAMKLFGYKW